MTRRDWLMPFLPTINRMSGGSSWCGLYYPCLCQGRVQKDLADFMERETGIRPDFENLTTGAAELLVEAIVTALPQTTGPVRASLSIVAYEVRRSAQHLDSTVGEEVRDLARGIPRDRPHISRPVRAGPPPPQGRSREERATQQASRIRDTKPGIDEAYRTQVKQALVNHDFGNVPLSRRARRLRQAYLETNFEVALPEGRQLVLRHGGRQPELDEWIRSQGANHRHWVFVTAWNPGELRPTDAENRAAQDRLRAVVSERGWPFLAAVGHLGNWREESLLVLVPRRSDGLALGAEFGQAAVLIGRLGGHAAVVPCRR